MKARHPRSRSPRIFPVSAFCLFCALLVLVMSVPALATTSFSDVPSSHPYAAAIQEMADYGIVNGYADGRFRPDDPVARQQFAKMIVVALSLPADMVNTCPFGDVEHGLSATDPLYPDRYVAVCASFGITTGVTAATFLPYGNMTTAQLVTMVARSAQLPDPPSSYSPPFTDFDPTHFPWARKAAYAGLLEGVWGPVGGSAQFWQTATRGEVCQVLHNLRAWRDAHMDEMLNEMRQAMAASGMVADDFEIYDYAVAGTWAGVIVYSPSQADSSVLLDKGSAGWQVVNAADNLSYQEWLDLEAPQGLATLLSRSLDLAVIREVLKDSGSFDVEFQIESYLFHRSYAGVVLSSPGLESCPVLLLRGLVGWAVLDFGTGLEYADWVGAGAPADIAAFLGGEPGD